nr:DUF3068 domain-containing protein [Allosalinactinospora lopnorensis]
MACGAFFATFALLLRLYVYGQLAVLPGDVEAELQLVDEAASYLDTGTWKTVEEAEVTRTTDIYGEPNPGDPGRSVWQMSVDTAAPNTMIAHMDRRVIVDRSTGRAVNCCGEHVDGDRAVRQAGLVLHWPANARGAEYPLYDADIRAAPRMVLDGEEDVAGVATRKYVQEIEATQIPDSAREVPAAALGLERRGTVTATRWLEVRRSYWIEPVSGHLVNAVEKRHETLRSESRAGERVLLDAEFAMPDHLVAAHAEEAESRSLLLTALRTWLPAGLGALGAALILVGLVRTWVGERRARDAEAPAAVEDAEAPVDAGDADPEGTAGR